MKADVIVVGLGSMGSAAAYHLTARGLRVVGLDRFAPPHQRGAHSGGSRIIRLAYLEGARYVPLARRSLRLWRELSALAGQTLLTPTGGLMLGAPDSTVVAGALAAARAHALDHELLDAAEIRRRFPAFAPAEAEVGVFEQTAGLVRPEAAIAALLRLATAHGATLHVNSAVCDWRADPSGVRVSTADRVFDADRLILAPGAWAPGLVRLDLPMRVQRRVQHYWHPKDPAAFAIGRFPIWIWEYGPGLAAYGLPAPAVAPAEGCVDGGEAAGGGHDAATRGFAVKAALHHGGEAVDPNVGAAPVRPEEVRAMRGWLATRVPALAEGRWAGSTPCLYTLTPDEHFVVGLHPDHRNVALACGFSGHGFKFTPVVGEILADLVTSGSTEHSIELFAPARSAR